MSKVCVIIPCYNEHSRILADNFIVFLNKHSNFSFVFVDDGSVDDTFSVLTALANQHENISCYRLDKNNGKAEAVRFGVNQSIQKNDFDYYGFIDADLAIPLEELERLYVELSHSDTIEFAYSSKNTKINAELEMKSKRLFVGRVLAKMVKWSLKIEVYDTQCGCKMMTKKIALIVFKDQFISSWLFDIEIFWRLINAFDRDYIAKSTKEIPLQKLFNRGSSKVSAKALIKLPLEFLKIHRFYKN